MATNPKDQEWYSIAEQITREMDSAKLGILVLKLCAALDRRTKPQTAGAHSNAKASSSVVLAAAPTQPSPSSERCSQARMSGSTSQIDYEQFSS
jgi:hypothetical protein